MESTDNVSTKELEKEEKNKDLVALIEKNLLWSQLVYEQNKRMERKLTIMAVAGYVKLLLILIPLILAFVYLPSILAPAIEQYQQLLGGGGQVNIGPLLENVSQEDVQRLLEKARQ